MDPNNHQVFLCLSNALYGGLYYLDTHNIININISLYYLPVLVFGVAGSYFNFYMTVNRRYIQAYNRFFPCMEATLMP